MISINSLALSSCIHHSELAVPAHQLLTPLQRAGLFVDSNFGLESGAEGWQYLPAPEYLVHTDQVRA
jgi:hypothetical protein